MNDQKEKKGLGCFGIGCLVLVIIGVLLAGGLGVGYYLATKSFRSFTADSGQAIQIETASPEEYQFLVKRMSDFKKAAPGSDLTLSLSAHDLNVLIANSPEWRLARGKIRASIDKGQVGLTGSIPLSSIPNLRDRYFNGAIFFTPSIESKVFHAKIQNIQWKGQDLPKRNMQAFASGLEPNLNNRLLGDPVIGAVLIKAETLKVEGDALVMTSAK